jgi:GH24 family phage-related lysozyme (muramidase)
VQTRLSYQTYTPVAITGVSFSSVSSIVSKYLPLVEGFEASPYWDEKQWSWGYGTAAGFDRNNKPNGTISRQQAMTDALQHVMNDYNYLKRLVTVNLSANQWAAFLLFSYNVGSGNADNLVSFLNNGDWDGFAAKFRQYVYSGGVKRQFLVDRRELELKLFFESSAGTIAFGISAVVLGLAAWLFYDNVIKQRPS